MLRSSTVDRNLTQHERIAVRRADYPSMGLRVLARSQDVVGIVTQLKIELRGHRPSIPSPRERRPAARRVDQQVSNRHRTHYPGGAAQVVRS
jgi:hypothetical protein